MGIVSYIFVFIISIISSIMFISGVLYSDRKSSEPVYMIILALLSGVFTIASSIIVDNLILPSLSYLNYEYYTFVRTLILAFVEESTKLIVLYFFIQKNGSFDDIYDGFVYSSLIALSFAAFETVMYVFNQTEMSTMVNLAIARGVTSVPLHLICGIVMGYYVGTEKFSKTSSISMFKLFMSLLLPTIIHTSYNYYLTKVISFVNTDLLFILLIMAFFIPAYIIGIFYINRTKKANEKFKNNNSPIGLFNDNEYKKLEEKKYSL